MPLELQTPLKNRLTQLLADDLRNARVFANYSVSGWSLRNLSGIKSFPSNGKLVEQLRKYIGEDPFYTFVVDELDAHFKGPGFDIEAAETPLSEYEGYGDLTAVASNLVAGFESLPWSYMVTVRLPNPFGALVSQGLGDVILTPRHKIVSGATVLKNLPLENRPNSLGNLLLGIGRAPAWDTDAAYLQVSVEGYFRREQTESFLRARDEVLTFFGLGIALGVFRQEVLGFQSADDKVSHFYVHQIEGSEWKELATIEIDGPHQQRMARTSVVESISRDSDLLRGKLARIGTVLRSDLGNQLALSARWLFNSYCGSDALLQYVQASVAIEILLGDEEADPNVGLTTLMANRCAYLIARTPTARANLL